MKLQFFTIKEIPKADSNHTCLAIFSLDSPLKKDENYYLQVFLKEWKYIKKKRFRYIIDDLESSFHDSDDFEDSEEEQIKAIRLTFFERAILNNVFIKQAILKNYFLSFETAILKKVFFEKNILFEREQFLKDIYFEGGFFKMHFLREQFWKSFFKRANLKMHFFQVGILNMYFFRAQFCKRI